MRFPIFLACAFSLPINFALAEPAAAPKAAMSVKQTLVPGNLSETVSVWVPAGAGVSRPQALRRLRERGFAVGRLVLDGEGIWLGEVAQNGRTIDVAVDPAGNVITW